MALSFSAPAYHCKSMVPEESPPRADTTEMVPMHCETALVCCTVDTEPILQGHSVLVRYGRRRERRGKQWLTELSQQPVAEKRFYQEACIAATEWWYCCTYQKR